MTPIPTRSAWYVRLIAPCQDFIETYRMYRVSHGRRYAARIAYQITFKGYPF